MKKISSILPSNSRITDVDLSKAGSRRPGAYNPSTGKVESNSRLKQVENSDSIKLDKVTISEDAQKPKLDKVIVREDDQERKLDKINISKKAQDPKLSKITMSEDAKELQNDENKEQTASNIYKRLIASNY